MILRLFIGDSATFPIGINVLFVSISAFQVLVQNLPLNRKVLFFAIFLAYLQIYLYLCALKGIEACLICRRRAAEPYHDIDKIAFAIYSLTYLET